MTIFSIFCILSGIILGGWTPWWLEIVFFIIGVFIVNSTEGLEALPMAFLLIMFTLGLIVGDCIVYFGMENGTTIGILTWIWNVISYPFTHRIS